MLFNHGLKARLWLLEIVSAAGLAVLALSSIWHTYHSKEILLGFIDQKSRTQQIGDYTLCQWTADGTGAAQHPA